MTINLRGKLMNFSVPKIMGILNITPDSFYDGGRYNSKDKIKKQIEKMIISGADIIDVGGYSCLLYTSPSPRDKRQSRMPSSA